MSLANPSHLSLTCVSSVALVCARRGESCTSSLTCTTRFPGLGSSPSPLASLMRRPLTSPTSLVLWSRGMPQSRRLSTRGTTGLQCPRGPEPSGRLLVETEAQVRVMDAEPLYGGSDLGKIRCSRGGPLCVAGAILGPNAPLWFSLSHTASLGIFMYLFSHLADAFIQSDLQMRTL